MARTSVPKTTAPGAYPTAGTLIAWTATNTTDGNQFTMTGNDLLLVYNTTGGALTFTINSVANDRNRTKDITTEAIGAGVVKCLGPFKNKAGWASGGGTLEFTASGTGVEWAVIKLS